MLFRSSFYIKPLVLFLVVFFQFDKISSSTLSFFLVFDEPFQLSCKPKLLTFYSLKANLKVGLVLNQIQCYLPKTKQDSRFKKTNLRFKILQVQALYNKYIVRNTPICNIFKNKIKYLHAWKTKKLILGCIQNQSRHMGGEQFIANYISSLNRQVVESLQEELRKDTIFISAMVGKYLPLERR